MVGKIGHTGAAIKIEGKGELTSVNERYTWNFHLSNKYVKCKKYIRQLAEVYLMDAENKEIYRIYDLYKSDVWVEIRFGKMRADIDAYIKPLLDALQGVVYENDRQVKKLSVEII
jgi:Holliday junction resolvase RusA-like endonuclease